ncbi:UNVERIFIED_CONTAM: hypothetical protein Scaly_1414400 [Sesamum calycinum]|uniref:Uncharacterized protein n=1 Tax=Sesamum calycinum TaxID=2727403 RepID=A0AAW2PM14_9LAMI
MGGKAARASRAGVSNIHYRDFNPKGGRPVARPWYSSGELKRRKRIAEYKLYSVEGKMKNRLRKGFRWVKNTCSRIVHGF